MLAHGGAQLQPLSDWDDEEEEHAKMQLLPSGGRKGAGPGSGGAEMQPIAESTQWLRLQAAIAQGMSWHCNAEAGRLSLCWGDVAQYRCLGDGSL